MKELPRSGPDQLPAIPTGWIWCTLGDLLCSIEAGRSFQCEERPPRNGETGVLKVSAVTWDEFNEAESKTCTESARISDQLLVRPGDFLFSRANTIALVGACVIVGSVASRVMLSDKTLRFRTRGVEKEWLLYALRSYWGRIEIERLSTGNQHSMRNIGQDRIKAIRIPLPALAEQRRIVAEIEKQFTRLDSADCLIKAVEREAEALTPSALAALASRMEMRWISLNHLFSDGSYGTSMKCKYEWSGTPVIRIPNIIDGNVCYQKMKRASAVMREHAYIARNDLLIVRTNGSRDLIGRAALVRETPASPHAFASYLIRLKLDPTTVNPEWIALIWNAPQIRSQLISTAATSAGQYNVSLSALKKVKVPVPERPVQDNLIQQLAATASLVRRASGSIGLMKKRSARLRQAILAKALSGQLVPQDPNDEPASVLLERIRAERVTHSKKVVRRKRTLTQKELALQS